jgi:hypothetical protein
MNIAKTYSIKDMFFASFYEIGEAASSWRSTKASKLSSGNAANLRACFCSSSVGLMPCAGPQGAAIS